MKMTLSEFYSSQATPAYSDYYQALKAEQRLLFMKYLNILINRARKFNPKNFNDSMNQYGISEGERIHMNIIGKLFEVRLEGLQSGKNSLKLLFSGGNV
jgi:hypothetical protein